MGAPGPKGDAGDVSEKGQKGEVNLGSFTSQQHSFWIFKKSKFIYT
jgi:hypothetical protein